jgi:hypothetical protein
MTPVLFVDGDERLRRLAAERGLRVVGDPRVLGWLLVEHGARPPALLLEDGLLVGEEVERWLTERWSLAEEQE